MDRRTFFKKSFGASIVMGTALSSNYDRIFAYPKSPAALPFDLVAVKGHRRIAYEVKVRQTLGVAAEQIASLRARARREGFDEFRLVVVNEPREIVV